MKYFFHSRKKKIKTTTTKKRKRRRRREEEKKKTINHHLPVSITNETIKLRKLDVAAPAQSAETSLIITASRSEREGSLIWRRRIVSNG